MLMELDMVTILKIMVNSMEEALDIEKVSKYLLCVMVGSHPLYWLETVKFIIRNNSFMFLTMPLADLPTQ